MDKPPTPRKTSGSFAVVPPPREEDPALDSGKIEAKIAEALAKHSGWSAIPRSLRLAAALFVGGGALITALWAGLGQITPRTDHDKLEVRVEHLEELGQSLKELPQIRESLQALQKDLRGLPSRVDLLEQGYKDFVQTGTQALQEVLKQRSKR